MQFHVLRPYPQVYLTVSASALDRNVPAMFDLMSEVVTSAKWAGEPARLGLLLSRRAASAGSSLGPQVGSGVDNDNECHDFGCHSIIY